jgi:hypothetical protein
MTNGGRVVDFHFIDNGDQIFEPNALWKDQCWGCGKVKKDLIKFRLQGTEPVGPQVLRDSYLMGQYCCTSCSCIGPTVPEICTPKRWPLKTPPPPEESKQEEDEAPNDAEPPNDDAAAVAPDHDDDDDDLGCIDGNEYDDVYDDYYENECMYLISDAVGHNQFWNSLNESQLQAMKDAGWGYANEDDSCHGPCWQIVLKVSDNSPTAQAASNTATTTTERDALAVGR